MVRIPSPSTSASELALFKLLLTLW